MVNGEGIGDPNKITLLLPSSLTERLFDADVVRFLTKLRDGSNLIMTFDIRSFHEGEWYTYGASPLQQASIDTPLWNAPLKVRLGETSYAVFSYLHSKDRTADWRCWVVGGNISYKACGRNEIGEYQFFGNRLFANAGECDLSDLACSTMLNQLLLRYDLRHTYKDVADVLNQDLYQVHRLRNGEEKPCLWASTMAM